MDTQTREQLLAQLTAERYGDREQLALERHDRGYLDPELIRERPAVSAGRRFLLMRGMADAHQPAETWRRPHVAVGPREEGAACR